MQYFIHNRISSYCLNKTFNPKLKHYVPKMFKRYIILKHNKHIAIQYLVVEFDQ